MKIVVLSDTHSLHNQVKIPKCDLLIHAGDITGNGSDAHFKNFLYWLDSLPAKYIIFCAGNHDEALQVWGKQEVKNYIKDFMGFHNIYYLEDELITIENLNIWGSPYTPDRKSVV